MVLPARIAGTLVDEVELDAAGPAVCRGWTGGMAVVTTAATVPITTITRNTITLRGSRGIAQGCRSNMGSAQPGAWRSSRAWSTARTMRRGSSTPRNRRS